MNLKQIPAQKIRLALKMTGGVTVGFAVTWAIIKFLITGSVIIPQIAHSEPCDSSYTLDLDNPSTYTITCGTIQGHNWNVKGDTCWLYTPLFNVGGNVSDPDRTVNISFRINQSGNLDLNDTAWVYCWTNGVQSYSQIYRGDSSAAVFTTNITLLVPSGGNYKIGIKFMNDKTNELWQLKNGELTTCLQSVSPLPVQFASFTGTAGKKNVQLKWSTACEMNNAFFTLERSADATNFFALAKVNGAGTSSAVHAYSFSDDTPLAGTSYYRLNQTDINGTTKTYKVISVLFSGIAAGRTSIHVSPNPFSDSFTAQFDAEEKSEAIVNILSTSGTMVYSEKINVTEGNNLYHFSTPQSIRNGTYILRVIADNLVLASTKIIKK